MKTDLFQSMSSNSQDMSGRGLFTVDLDADDRESVEFDITTTGRRGTALHKRDAGKPSSSQYSDRKHQQLMGTRDGETDTVEGDLGSGGSTLGSTSRSVPKSASYNSMSGRDEEFPDTSNGKQNLGFYRE